MKNKYLSFAKNAGIAVGAMVAAGAGSSELTDLFTDNGKVISAISTISEYVIGWGVFLPLQAHDNKDVYCNKEGKFNRKQFIWDNTKFGLSFLALDAIYLIGRPFLQYYFLNQGVSASKSSIFTDGFFVTAYSAAAVGLARLTGVIKPKKKNLEVMIKP